MPGSHGCGHTRSSPATCVGPQENLERQRIKAMLAQWDAEQPGRVDNIARALRNVTPSHLADPALSDFAGLKRSATLMPLKDLTAA